MLGEPCARKLDSHLSAYQTYMCYQVEDDSEEAITRLEVRLRLKGLARARFLRRKEAGLPDEEVRSASNQVLEITPLYMVLMCECRDLPERKSQRGVTIFPFCCLGAGPECAGPAAAVGAVAPAALGRGDGRPRRAVQLRRLLPAPRAGAPHHAAIPHRAALPPGMCLCVYHLRAQHSWDRIKLSI